MTPEPWWWLSFADAKRPKGTQFLGVVCVRGRDMVHAVKRAHQLKINPGGEVRGWHLDDLEPPNEFWERLLSRDEAEKLRDDLDTQLLEA